MSEPLDAEAMEESANFSGWSLDSCNRPPHFRYRLRWLSGLLTILVVTCFAGVALGRARSPISQVSPPTATGPDNWVGVAPQ